VSSLINNIIASTHTPNTAYKSDKNFSKEAIKAQESTIKFFAPLANQQNLPTCNTFDSCPYPKLISVVSLPRSQNDTPTAIMLNWVIEEFDDNASQNDVNSSN